MKKTAICLLVLASFVFLCGFGSAPSKPASTASSASGASGYPLLVDNYEDGDHGKAPEWFTFDNIKVTIEKNVMLKEGDKDVIAKLGAYSLGIKGSTNRWYVGGMGTMLGIDPKKYKSIEVDIYGYGEGSGKLKIELYDNDARKNEVEVDSKWLPTKDDLFYYEIDVNWRGWKHISIPFADMKLANPGKATGQLDAEIIKLQLIFVANAETGSVKMALDNLELGN